MPTVKDAAVLVQGTVSAVDPASNYETGEYEGVRVLLATGDGFAQVKLNPKLTNELGPKLGDRVAWIVRYGVVAGEGRVTQYSSFVRKANVADVESLAAVLGAK